MVFRFTFAQLFGARGGSAKTNHDDAATQRLGIRIYCLLP